MLGEYNKQFALPYTAASAINPFQTVVLDSTATSTNKRAVTPVATNNVEPVGISGPATALPGESVTIYKPGALVEAISVASIGAAQDVGVSSSNGALGAVSGASGITRYRTARTVEPAGAGERFTVEINPKQLSNLI